MSSVDNNKSVLSEIRVTNILILGGWYKLDTNLGYICNLQMNILNLILTILGILVSGFGLYYAIIQVKGLQKITKQYQEQVKQEVSTAQQKIRDGLLISEITLCLKNLESTIKYIRDGKVELAMLRMEDIETTLHNSSLSECYLTNDQQLKFKEAIDDYKDSLRSVIKYSRDKKNLNNDFIIDSLSSIRSFLSIIDNNLKISLYGKRS